MAKFSSTQAKDFEADLAVDEDFDFDEDEDAFMERSQRKLLQSKRERIPRMRDY
ncbi:MAG: hypothetical protein ACK46X_13530 [Candidatus Sericytochromatia bacterium]